MGGAVSEKNFFPPFDPQFGLKIRGSPGPPPPPPSDPPVASHDLAGDWVGILPFYSQFLSIRITPYKKDLTITTNAKRD